MHRKGVVVGSYAANMRGLFITFLNYMGVSFGLQNQRENFNKLKINLFI
jgi:hypothetical protein